MFNVEKIIGAPIWVLDEIIRNKDKYINIIYKPKKDPKEKRRIVIPSNERFEDPEVIGVSYASYREILKNIHFLLRKYRAHPCSNGFVLKKNISTNATFLY